MKKKINFIHHPTLTSYNKYTAATSLCGRTSKRIKTSPHREKITCPICIEIWTELRKGYMDTAGNKYCTEEFWFPTKGSDPIVPSDIEFHYKKLNDYWNRHNDYYNLLKEPNYEKEKTTTITI